MKLDYRHYLYMVSIALFVTLFFSLDLVLFIIPYSNGGIKHFDNFNKTWPFFQCKMETVIFK